MKENIAKASYQNLYKALLHVKRKFIKSLIFSCQPLSFLYNLPCVVFATLELVIIRASHSISAEPHQTRPLIGH